MVGSMYQAETPAGLCKYKDNEKGNQAPGSLSLIPDLHVVFRQLLVLVFVSERSINIPHGFVIGCPVLPVSQVTKD